MTFEKPKGPACPQDVHWERMYRIFGYDPGIIAILQLLRRFHKLRVKDYPKLLERDRRVEINGGLRKSYLPFRIVAEPPGPETPYQDKVIELIEIEVHEDRREKVRQEAPPPGPQPEA